MDDQLFIRPHRRQDRAEIVRLCLLPRGDTDPPVLVPGSIRIVDLFVGGQPVTGLPGRPHQAPEHGFPAVPAVSHMRIGEHGMVIDRIGAVVAVRESLCRENRVSQRAKPLDQAAREVAVPGHVVAFVDDDDARACRLRHQGIENRVGPGYGLACRGAGGGFVLVSARDTGRTIFTPEQRPALFDHAAGYLAFGKGGDLVNHRRRGVGSGDGWAGDHQFDRRSVRCGNASGKRERGDGDDRPHPFTRRRRARYRRPPAAVSLPVARSRGRGGRGG